MSTGWQIQQANEFSQVVERTKKEKDEFLKKFNNQEKLNLVT